MTEETEKPEELEEKTKMSIAGFLKIITGTGVVIFVMKYARRIADIIALVLFVTAGTKLLSPYLKWAEYIGNNIILFVVSIVSGMFLLASLIGKKKVKPVVEEGSAYMDMRDESLWDSIKSSPLVFNMLLVFLIIAALIFSFQPLKTDCSDQDIQKGKILFEGNTRTIKNIHVEDDKVIGSLRKDKFSNLSELVIVERNINEVKCYK